MTGEVTQILGKTHEGHLDPLQFWKCVLISYRCEGRPVISGGRPALPGIARWVPLVIR